MALSPEQLEQRKAQKWEKFLKEHPWFARFLDESEQRHKEIKELLIASSDILEEMKSA